jgi:cytochrome P450
MSEAEVATQIRTLLVAGYETTSGMHVTSRITYRTERVV